MANLIKPMIYADLVREKFEGKVKVASLATNVGFLNHTTIGETVTFPVWNKISDAEDVVKGTAVGTEELTQKSTQATIKQVAPHGIPVYDVDDITALGVAIEEGATQQGIVIARKLDTDLIAEAMKTDLKVATANALAITGDELNAGFSMFGDEQDVEDMAGIVINSLVLPSLLKDDMFTSVERTFTANGAGVVHNGLVGYFRGIPVFMTDKGTYDSKANECVTFIIKKNALGYMVKRDITVEEKREPELFRSTVFSNMIYATKLMMEDGVVILKKTI